MKSLEDFLTDCELYKLKVASIHGIRLNFKYANGCGAKGGIKFPKTMWGLNIESTCVAHDISWQMAKSLEDLLEGNEDFDDNLKLIIDAESNFIMKRLRRMRASKYITEVELLGTPSEAKRRGFGKRGK